MTRVLSGVQPTGEVHIGNYIGALRHWAADQHEHESFYCVVDLHAMTMGDHDPAELREGSLDVATILLATGIDPSVAPVFLQSQVAEHTRLTWLLECVASIGELRRMTQGDTFVSHLLRAGVAVLRPDYPGLGSPGPHPYLIGPALAASVLDLLVAACSAFPLADRWVSAGHSEGAVAAPRPAPTTKDPRVTAVRLFCGVEQAANKREKHRRSRNK